MNLTEEQRLSIYGDVSNTIVSAGAGSGKTFVLSKRILNHLINGVSVEDLIVLTFTNEAAREMKERVIKNVKESLSEYPHLEEQLDLLDNAQITTFDGYALYIVKKYYYYLDLSPNIGIIESSIIELKKKEILRELLDSYYENDNNEFMNLVLEYETKSDDKLFNCILDVHKNICTLSDKDNILENYNSIYSSCEVIQSNINEFKGLIDNEYKNMYQSLENLLNMSVNESLYVYFDEIKLVLDEFTNLNDDDIATYEFKLPRRPVCKDLEESDKTYISSNVDSIKKRASTIIELRSVSLDEYENYLKRHNKFTETIMEIVKELDNMLLQFKKSISMYEFTDIFTFLIKLLSSNDDIREEIKYRIKEIMIDEYQDTSDIQDYFISLIKNDNVFIVGDLKQSIYGFRYANPKIFLEKYKLYEKNGIKIDLNKNFRSREEVLGDINNIFSYILSEEIGGIDYTDSQMLVYGNKSFETKNNLQNYNVEFYNYSYKDFKEKYNSKYSKEEYEAFLVAQDIKEKLDSKYQILDKNTNALRDCRYDDFVILIDKKSSFELFQSIFTYLNLPLTIIKDQPFITSTEIVVVQNLLRLLKLLNENKLASKEGKHALYSVYRSFLFSLNDEEIIKLLNTNLYELDVICKLKTIDYSKSSIVEVILALFSIFDIYLKSISLGNTQVIHSRLDYLIDIASNLTSSNFTLNESIDYFLSISKYDIKMTFSVKEPINNTVKIMSIHNSKGLEFNIVYFCLMSSKWLFDNDSTYKFNNKYGIVLPFRNENYLVKNFYNYLIKDINRKEVISEKIRLLYVALTRSVEKMIIVCDLNHDYINEDLSVITTPEKLKYTSFNDILVSIKRFFSQNIIDVAEPFITDLYKLNIDKTIELDTKVFDYNELNIQSIKPSYDNTYHELLTEDLIKLFKSGTLIHEEFEYINKENKYVNRFLNSDFIKHLNIVNIYTEYEFYYNDSMYIIDMLLETTDGFIIIDYKLKDIEKDSYIKQLSLYSEYILNITGKRPKAYLYSILDNNFKQIEEVL